MCVSSVFRPIVLFRLSWSFVLFSFNNQECVNESREITFSKPKIVSSLAVRILKSFAYNLLKILLCKPVMPSQTGASWGALGKDSLRT